MNDSRVKPLFLEWKYGRAEVISLAGMLRQCTFHFASGRQFSPLARAPWAGMADVDRSLPGHMQELGGEFVCLPFGSDVTPADLTARWHNPRRETNNRTPHGASADGEWTVVEHTASHVELSIDYPASDPVERLTRRISADPAAPALIISVTIYARRPVRLPFALHPVFKLPARARRAELHVPFRFGLTYPALLPPGASRLIPDAEFQALSAIPSLGSVADLSRLPLEAPCEDLVQLCGVTGEASLAYLDEGARVKLTWNPLLLPSCVLWVSDRALQDPPWRGAFRGIGVEPAAAAFDLPISIAAEPNPMSVRGIPTALPLDPRRPVVLEYRLAAEECLPDTPRMQTK
jgi:hypothetical protein